MIKASLRTRIALFVAILMALAIMQLIFQQWGRQWAIAMYKPVLQERVANAIAQDNYARAESDLLMALTASPQFKNEIESMAARYFAVMPELRLAIVPPTEPATLDAPGDQPQDPYARGMALLRAGKINEAETAFRASTEADAYRQLGMILEEKKESRDAVQAYSEAVARSTAPYAAAQRLLAIAP